MLFITDKLDFQVTLTMKCNVCEELESKYRCPKCFIRYCTLKCYKKHKVNQCQQADGQTTDEYQELQGSEAHLYKRSENSLDEENTADKVCPEMLDKLGDSKELLEMLKNPHLQHIVKHLDSSGQPNDDIEFAMQEPIFTEFVDQCLKIVEPQKLALDHT